MAEPLVVAALYRFTPWTDPAAIRGPLEHVCRSNGVRGTVLLATEGINGTVAGTRAGVDTVLAHLRTLPGCSDLIPRESTAPRQPYRRMKVRVKREIVTMGAGDVDPTAAVGHYVDPQDWNDLIAADDVVLIDTRNDYEVAIGTFSGAIDPGTQRFRDFPGWWQANAQHFQGKRIAMFCTGGIRCEKSTSWLRQHGVEDVFHLRGGILAYLEQIPPTDSRWAGQCFVFDSRVSVGHGLQPGDHTLCHACRRPLSAEQTQHPAYARGVSCHRCIDERSPQDRLRYAERQRQVDLAARRGEDHLAAEVIARGNTAGSG
ncbi:MAG TPA: rhodanese-related sulfurtransferase [Euzebya sp.]|nr:rhodanese-related sulfurtransferase [Euzebya sp.]